MDPKLKIETQISLIELEIGFLRSLRMNPDPQKSVVAGELEIRRSQEVTDLRRQLNELEMAA